MNSVTIGAGPPRFVFLHGLFGRGHNWTMIAKRLLPWASVLVDLPDHGTSAWTSRFSYADMAASVADLIATLPAPVCLVGHSMGGRVAMMTALTHPVGIDRLVIEDTAPAPLDMSEFVTLAQAMADLPLTEITTRRAARDWLRPRVGNERVLGFLLQNLQPGADGRWRWVMNLDLLRRDMALVGVWPPVTGQFNRPTLWITGEESARTDPSQLAALTALFPLARHVGVKRAGHWVHADAPTVFVEAVRRFATPD
ncbi:MAG: alpha/beta fold hydrolase [Propionibacteriaceae bacterium]|jgi:pimeloyl-ACP methyl ester carboxylesterase|nr:alpha/beta fold hydrolase [Propionibacteriaceae bacterium]